MLQREVDQIDVCHSYFQFGKLLPMGSGGVFGEKTEVEGILWDCPLNRPCWLQHGRGGGGMGKVEHAVQNGTVKRTKEEKRKKEKRQSRTLRRI